MSLGALVFMIAAELYVVALVSYPRRAMLKGFDLGVYRAGGLLAAHDPLRLYGWQLIPGVKFTYPPFAALLFEPLAHAPVATLMQFAVPISTGALLGTVWIAFRDLGLPGASRLGATLLVTGIAFWSQPVQRSLYLGQVELVLMGMVVWDLCQPDERRWKGALTGVAAGIKLVPLIFIAYLLITRRLRQAGVAAAAFGATILAGFAALPQDSVKFWFGGYFLGAGRTGFVGSLRNQSLRGVATRLVGSVAAGQTVWLIAALVVGVAGLCGAALLYRAGRRFESLMACALTGLLTSPISWDAHWVWIGPGIAVFVAGAILARDRLTKMACATAAVVLAALFSVWQSLWATRSPLHGSGLLLSAPHANFGYVDNPRYPEYHWHGPQLLTGNLYVLIGIGLFVLMLWRAAPALHHLRSARRTAAAAARS